MRRLFLLFFACLAFAGLVACRSRGAPVLSTEPAVVPTVVPVVTRQAIAQSASPPSGPSQSDVQAIPGPSALPTATSVPPSATAELATATVVPLSPSPVPPSPTAAPPTPTPVPATPTSSSDEPASWLKGTTLLGMYGRAFGVAPILGRLGSYQNFTDMAKDVAGFSDQIKAVNGGKPVLPMVHLFYALAMPCSGNGDCLFYLEGQDPNLVDDYIKPAQQRGWLVLLDT